MIEHIEVEAQGGPLDGARFFIGPWQKVEVAEPSPPGETRIAVYALAVTNEGRFSLKYLASHSTPT